MKFETTTVNGHGHDLIVEMINGVFCSSENCSLSWELHSQDLNIYININVYKKRLTKKYL